MELSAVLSLKDKLSANMNKAANSVGSMITKVNEANNAIVTISKSRGINLTATTNISTLVDTAKTNIAELKQEASEIEVELQTKGLDPKSLNFDTINQNITQYTATLNDAQATIEQIEAAKKGLAEWQEIGIKSALNMRRW